MRKETIRSIFSHIPELYTPRLYLRAMLVADAEDMFDYAKDPEVSQFLTWDAHPDVGFTKKYLTYVGQQYRTGNFFDWAVIHRESGRMIGTCGFTCFRYESNAAEIGYVLHPAYRGRGLATEAVRAIMEFGFLELDLHRIEARYMQENAASRQLMDRVGMTFEGLARESLLVKDQYRTIGTCAILQREFMERGM